MGIQSTSLETFFELEYHLDTHEQIVLNCIKKNPNVSDNDIQRITHLRINDVTGRRNNLWKKGLIDISGNKKDRITGRNNLTWSIIEPNGKELTV